MSKESLLARELLFIAGVMQVVTAKCSIINITINDKTNANIQQTLA